MNLNLINKHGVRGTVKAFSQESTGIRKRGDAAGITTLRLARHERARTERGERNRLMQAPRIGRRHLRERLSELNFNPVAYIECVFERATNNTRIRMLAYVDVLLISKSTPLIQEVKSELQAKSLQ
jgi:hypothetical protein